MVLWAHSNPRSTRLDAFRHHVNAKHGLALADYPQLHRWSVNEVGLFNNALWEFSGIVTSAPASQAAIGIEKLWPRPQWFPGARLNFAENLLALGLAAHQDKIAVSACAEGGIEWKNMTWKQLEQHTALYASALRNAGVGVGDRVATVTTNSLETLLILLAVASIGAIFSSTSPEMGAKGIVERFSLIEPKVLFVQTEVTYGGQKRDMSSKLKDTIAMLKKRLTEPPAVVLVAGPSWGDDVEATPLSSFLEVPVKPLQFEQLPFDHPVYVVYSSGTTGPPKCICHSAGGALLKHKQDLSLMMDLSIDSTYYQYSTTGWMMWNVLVGSLSVGARIVLYDGNPLYPSPLAQLRLLEEQRVTHWGTSPKFLAALMRSLKGSPPALDSLQSVLVAGSALPLEVCDWFYSTFPKQVALVNGSGGTDVLGSVMGGGSLLPVHGNELAAPGLGMDIQIWDVNGTNIEDSGEKGELVITTPFPSMPVSFWGTQGSEKYRKAYFDVYPGIWCHGDFVSKNPTTGGYTIHGRSDGVLNPGGVRFGTAELYDIVSSHFPTIEDCIAVGQRRPGDQDEQVLLFIKMAARGSLDEQLRSDICRAIRTSLSSRHVPAHVLQVEDIPYTLNGKRIENAVKSVVCGEVPNVGSGIANPECLGEYSRFASLPLVGQPAPKAKL